TRAEDHSRPRPESPGRRTGQRGSPDPSAPECRRSRRVLVVQACIRLVAGWAPLPRFIGWARWTARAFRSWAAEWRPVAAVTPKWGTSPIARRSAGAVAWSAAAIEATTLAAAIESTLWRASHAGADWRSPFRILRSFRRRRQQRAAGKIDAS